MASALTRPRLYWILQGTGWGAYAALNLLLFVTAHEAWAGVVGASVTLGCGIGFTHGLRALARGRGWLALSGPALAIRVLGACVAMSALTNLAAFITGR